MGFPDPRSALTFEELVQREENCRANAVAEDIEGGAPNLRLIGLMTSPY